MLSSSLYLKTYLTCTVQNNLSNLWLLHIHCKQVYRQWRLILQLISCWKCPWTLLNAEPISNFKLAFWETTENTAESQTKPCSAFNIVNTFHITLYIWDTRLKSCFYWLFYYHTKSCSTGRNMEPPPLSILPTAVWSVISSVQLCS